MAFVKKEPKSEVKKVEEKKEVIYFCSKGEYQFSLVDYERDDFGVIIRNADGKGKKLYATDSEGNNKREILLHFKFDRIPVRDPVTGKTDAMQFLGMFILTPENERYDDIYAHLEKARKNPLSGIKTHDEHKKNRNPEAFAIESKLKMYEGENAALLEYNRKLAEKLKAAGIDPDSIEN